jgi:glycosyltransferase involved in cell wall biosynthesis
LELLIVSGKPYHHPEAKFPIQNASWSLKSERELLRKMTIGIMPLRDSEMERGKCGFKLIQYMGMGIVSIASAVGVNNNIIKHGKNGFLVDKNSAWEEVFDEAIAAAAKYQAIGEAARHTIAEKYSFKAHRSAYLHFIQTYSSE